MCGTGSEWSYTLPAVAAVAGIVGFVTWLRKKKAA
jgi:LPXTG-motif cell wall-anchored protein